MNVTSYFTSDYDNANFAIEVMLIAEDLYGTGSGWNQSNYYSGYSVHTRLPSTEDCIRIAAP